MNKCSSCGVIGWVDILPGNIWHCRACKDSGGEITKTMVDADARKALESKLQELERENARLRMELDASCNAEELRQIKAENAKFKAALEYIAHAELSSRHCQDEARKVLKPHPQSWWQRRMDHGSSGVKFEFETTIEVRIKCEAKYTPGCQPIRERGTGLALDPGAKAEIDITSATVIGDYSGSVTVRGSVLPMDNIMDDAQDAVRKALTD